MGLVQLVHCGYKLTLGLVQGREGLEASLQWSSEVRAKKSGFAPWAQGTHCRFSGRGEGRESKGKTSERANPTTPI